MKSTDVERLWEINSIYSELLFFFLRKYTAHPTGEGRGWWHWCWWWQFWTDFTHFICCNWTKENHQENDEEIILLEVHSWTFYHFLYFLYFLFKLCTFTPWLGLLMFIFFLQVNISLGFYFKRRYCNTHCTLFRLSKDMELEGFLCKWPYVVWDSAAFR